MDLNTLKDFKRKLESFPKNSSDYNIICTITYSEYRLFVSILTGLFPVQSSMKSQLETVTNSIDSNTYSDLIKGLNGLNSIYKSVLPDGLANTSMTFDIGKTGDLITETCQDFLGSIPESLFNIFQDIRHGILGSGDFTNDLIGLPFNLTNGIGKSLLSLKDSALQELFGSSIFRAIISPLIEYEDFLTDNGIFTMIKKMEAIERCMTKPGVCNRDRRDFIHPQSKKLYSAYFKSQFLVDSKGNLNIKTLGSTSAQKTQLNTVLNNLRGFRLNIK